MRLTALLWTLLATAAGLMGIGLMDPITTDTPWFLAFAIAGLSIAVAALYLRRPPAVAAASVLLTAAVALHYLAIVEFAFHGLSAILLVLAVPATLAALVAWLRSRRPTAIEREATPGSGRP